MKSTSNKHINLTKNQMREMKLSEIKEFYVYNEGEIVAAILSSSCFIVGLYCAVIFYPYCKNCH